MDMYLIIGNHRAGMDFPVGVSLLARAAGIGTQPTSIWHVHFSASFDADHVPYHTC
jgi:hypothetical protein